jgi:hypothetical protein
MLGAGRVRRYASRPGCTACGGIVTVNVRPGGGVSVVRLQIGGSMGAVRTDGVRNPGNGWQCWVVVVRVRGFDVPPRQCGNRRRGPAAKGGEPSLCCFGHRSMAAEAEALSASEQDAAQ